jgi:hypothetical protein
MLPAMSHDAVDLSRRYGLRILAQFIETDDKSRIRITDRDRKLGQRRCSCRLHLSSGFIRLLASEMDTSPLPRRVLDDSGGVYGGTPNDIPSL